LLTSYFLALGRVAHSWNQLHEELAKLFCVTAALEESTGIALWHALRSDRSQRDLLNAALDAAGRDARWSTRFPAATDDIRWLLKQVNALAERRNDAVHAPCSVITGELKQEIAAISHSGNPRARNLRDKDIPAEFAWYEQTADVLRQHARELQAALASARDPWPERPPLPTLGQRSDRPDQHRRASTGLPRRRR